ncbi:hypothetical protein MT418_001405 [Batrachochytrium dendrobatidis]
MPRFLLAFDFDHTMIDEDSDAFVFQQLAPELHEKMKELYSTGEYVWTDLMDLLLGDLYQKGVHQHTLTQKLGEISFSHSMKKALELASSMGSEIVVISDANTVYIDTITKAKGINNNISKVITNPGYFDTDGRLRVKRWTTEPAHECIRCSVNLCKGKEILELIRSNGPFDRVIYLGDGQNDYCPSTKLNRFGTGSHWAVFG